MINPELIVEPKKSWGETRIYPKCDMALGFTRLLGQETLTIRAESSEPMDELAKLGIKP